MATPADTGSSGSFNFPDGSTYAAGLNMGEDHRRSRPRMKKLRRKQTVSCPVEYVLLQSNGTGNGVTNAFGSSHGMNGNNVTKFGNSDRGGLSFGGVGKVESLFNSSSNFYSDDGTHGSSKLGVEKESESFVFGATMDGSKKSMNVGNSENKCGASADTKSSSGQFIFGAVKSESGGISKLGVKGSSEKMRQPQGTIEKLSSKNKSCTDASNVVPQMTGQAKFDTCGDPKKIHQTCFQFSAGSSHGHSKNHVNMDGLEEHNRDTGSDFKFDSKINIDSSSSFEKCPVSNLLEEMKKLNIENSEAYGGNSNSFSSEFSVGANNVFVFKSNRKDSTSVKWVHPANIFGDNPKDDTATPGISSSLLATPGSSALIGAHFTEVPSMKKDDKDNINFKQNMYGFDASGADFNPPNLNFDFSNISNGIHQLDPANSKFLRTRRLKKKNEKLRPRSMVKQLFSHDTPSREGGPLENLKSPEQSSPMDFSPYQETNDCNTPAADEKVVPQPCERPNDNNSNSNFPPLLHAEDGLSSIARQYKKKYKLKGRSSRSVLCNNFDKEKSKQIPEEGTPYEVCEHWRKRGNQAYQAGKFSEAEEFYTLGINASAQYLNTPECPTEPFLLCYSNRAATRMTLGRMREAIEDCKMASAIDPNFLKVTLRAGNCYLVLGEVEDAIQRFSMCLGSGTDVCLDRRFKIEAAKGLQKAKNVAEKMNQSFKLLQEGTISAADSALGKITEALSISRYSESLLKMKGEALCILRMFDEVIQLCDQTIDSAKKNLAADQLVDPRGKNPCELWRLHLLIKSHYHMGRLDNALDLIEQENIPLSFKPGNSNEESPTDLGITIRQLLCLKKSGNEAFRSGKFAEAVEHYTTAITKSVDSGPFMAICFCNRAAAYQSVNQVVDAILDCSLALALDENYQKAMSRRATLHEMIRDYKQAADDVKRLISLLEKQLKVKIQQADPQSKSSGGIGKDLRRARRHLSTIEEKAKKESPLDFYLILGIKATDTEAEIKKAYRKAALKHHPDKAGHVLPRSDVVDDGTMWKEVGKKIHDDADRLFKIIGEAYSVLSDPSKRSKYDSDEETRNIYRESNRGSNSGHPSTSYSCWSEKSGGSYGRNNRRYWYGSGSYYSQPRW